MEESIKNRIKANIHELMTHKQEYSCLCGIEILEPKFTYIFNFSVAGNNHVSNSDLKIFLDNILTKLISYNIDNIIINDNSEKNYIHIGENKYENVFITNSVDLTNIRLCDIENHIDNIIILEHDNHISFTLELPIYLI